MKKLVCILTIVSLLVMSMYSYGMSIAQVSNAANAKIDSKIKEFIATATDPNEKIPVSIELADTIDAISIENDAMEIAGVSYDDLETQSSATLTEEENIQVQAEILKKVDAIKVARNELVADHYYEMNSNFATEQGINENREVYISKYSPFIMGDVSLIDILELVQDPKVVTIQYTGDVEYQNFGALSLDTLYKNVSGNVAVDSGYTGQGLRVGMIELAHPDAATHGLSPVLNIYEMYDNKDKYVNNEIEHATEVCGIIRKFSPSCMIYSSRIDAVPDNVDFELEYSTTCSPDNNTVNFFSQLEILITGSNPHVINISCGKVDTSSTTYTKDAKCINYIIQNCKIPMAIAAGNKSGDPTSKTYDRINTLGSAPNAITVGAVERMGSGYDLSFMSCYEEVNTFSINKPDICAPGSVSEYSDAFSAGPAWTSFSTAVVTGTIVQMIARDSLIADRPQLLKAILMASAHKNGGSNMEYFSGLSNCISNEEGAGVINSGYCFKAASNIQYHRHIEFTSNTLTPSTTYLMYVEDTSSPIRIAFAWDATSASSAGTINIDDFALKVYKDDILVAESDTPSNLSSPTFPGVYGRTNYEVVEISSSELAQYGEGYYKVKVVSSTSFQGSSTIGFGWAWTQKGW